jgi:hypothetical protein
MGLRADANRWRMVSQGYNLAAVLNLAPLDAKAMQVEGLCQRSHHES